jgi:hypothetical protein
MSREESKTETAEQKKAREQNDKAIAATNAKAWYANKVEGHEHDGRILEKGERVEMLVRIGKKYVERGIFDESTAPDSKKVSEVR